MSNNTRKQSEGDVYHVIMRGEGRMILFEDDEDRLCFLNMLSSALERTGAEVWAWCLMSNHVHLLLKVGFDDMPRLMQRLSGGYAVYFNKRHDHVGHVFAGRYSSFPIEGDEHLMTVVRYIHFNPVEEHLSKTCEYRWSSYGDYLAASGMTSTGFVLEVMGGVGRFAEFHDPSRSKMAQAKPLQPKVMLENAGHRHDDEQALIIAQKVLEPVRLADVAALDKATRNEAIVALRRSGISAKQVERFTGIGRGIVERVKWRE